MTAHAAADIEPSGDTDHGPEPPQRRGRLSRGWTIALTAVGAAALYLGLSRVAGLHETWRRLSSGDPIWLCAAVLLEVASYAAYVFTFHRLFARPGSRIGWRESYDIALAGVVASRVLATAGAGGIALTAWALDRSGMRRELIVRRLTTFYVLLYGIFMAALVVVGAGLRTGVLNGPAPFGLTVVPAIFGGVAILAALAASRLPPDLGARAAERLSDHRQAGKWVGRAAGWVATLAQGVRGAVDLVRARDSAVAGALCWWTFDIGVLWACLEAFGEPPASGVVVMAYLAGTLGNILPLPGGLGGVEGAMIGALVGFHVDAALAVTAVLGYRAFEYWLPIIPGVLAYVRLLRTVKGWSEEPAPGSHKACDDPSPHPAPS
jgi:uncharacterized membrane protein YbhN (UPF0104 family)